MIKSKRVLTKSFKVMACGMLLCGSVAVSAELTMQDKALFKASKERALEVDLGDLMDGISRQHDKGAALIGSTLDRSKDIAMAPGGDQEEAEKRAEALCAARTRYLFASRSLGKPALEEIFAEASANPDLTVVFQGIPKGTKIPAAFLDLQQLAKDFDPMPSIALNPLLFQRHNVTSVPELMALTEGEWRDQKCHQEVRSRVAGITSLSYIESRLDEGDLGQRGPIEDVSEPNLMDVIAKRINEVDWDSQKKKALSNVWNNIQMFPLPPAPENRIVKIDPTVESIKDIKDAEGNIIVPAGKRINPLDIQGFDSIVIVFNPLRESEMKAAKKLVKKYTANGTKVIPLLSEIDKTEGWEMYNEVARELQHRVFMLTSDVKQRFHIMHTMSVVRASKSHFEVREIKVGM